MANPPSVSATLPPGLKILHVLDHSVPLHSGYSFRTLALLREQRRLGWRTAQLTTPKHTLAGPDPEEVDGFLFYRTPATSGALPKMPGVDEMRLIRAAARRIREVAARENPDILHAHSPVLNALACLWVSRSLGLPIVYEVRGLWEDAAVSHGTSRDGSLSYRVSRLLETLALRRSDAITTICAGLSLDMQRRGLPAEKITIIPNGVDPVEFPFMRQGERDEAAASLARSLGLEGKTVLGFIGSFYSYEGLDILLAAMPALLQASPDIRLLLVGGGPAEPQLKQQAKSLGLEAAVRFVGRVPHAAVMRYYALVDIFVYPRRSMRLTEKVTPLKPLEAMAIGGIVLASDVGGHRELVREGETGYLFKADNPVRLAAALGAVLGRREEWEAMWQRARHYVESERTWSIAAAGYVTAYAAVLRAGRRRR